MKKFLLLATFLLATAPALFAGSGKSQTYTGGTVTGDVLLDNEIGTEKEASSQNRINISGGAFDGNITVGVSETGDALKNELNITGGTFGDKKLQAGYSKKENATDNRTTLKNVTTAVSLVAGNATAGTAQNNTLTLENSTLNLNATADNYAAAGETATGTTTKNTLNIIGSTVATNAYGGYATGAGSADHNVVNVSGASVLNGNVHGGYSKDGTATYNTVNIRGTAQAGGKIYGGYAEKGNATHNTVNLQEQAKATEIYGGYVKTADAVLNKVTIANTATLNDNAVVAGGYVDTLGNASNNSLAVNSNFNQANGNFYGGYTLEGTANDNKVSITAPINGANVNVYGGYSKDGTALSGNTVSISGTAAGNAVAGVYGAKNLTGNVALNTVNLSSALTATELVGADAAPAGAALVNTVNLTGSAFSGNLIGGRATNGSAAGNTVNVLGGSVTGNIYGGYGGLAATGNTVNLVNTTVTGDVYGGYGNGTGATTGNTVILEGNTVVNGNFYGGDNSAVGNTLLLQNYNGTINAINNFDTITLKGLNSNVNFTTAVDAGVMLSGKPSGFDQIIATTPTGSTLKLNYNVLGVYAYDIRSTPNGANLDWSVRGVFSEQLAKPYAQLPLAGLALAGLGDNMLAMTMASATNKRDDKNTFFSAEYFDREYETGSGFDMNSFVLQAGSYFRLQESWVFGFFGQYGYGSYKTFPTKAEGNINSFAAGGFGFVEFSDTGRIEATARVGYQDTDFESATLTTDFKTTGLFYGASLGLTEQFEYLDIYGRFSWLRKQGKDKTDSIGQNIDFEDAQTLNAKAGLRYKLRPSKSGIIPYIGVAGIYEFDGESKTSIDDHKIGNTQMDGATLETELGFSYESQEPLLPLKTLFSIYGLFGQNSGFGGSLKFAIGF